MSRFFRSADSDSDTSDSDFSSDDSRSDQSGFSTSDSDDLSGSDDEEVDDQAAAPSAKKSGASRFMYGASDSEDSEESEDEDEDEARKAIRSARDKRYGDMRSIVKALANVLKIKDWVNIQNEFDRLTKSLTKSAAMIEREGVPRFVVRSLVELDDNLKEFLASKDAAKKMNALAAKALNAMKQKVKKITKTYEADLLKFRESPVDEDESEEEAIEQARIAAKEQKQKREEEQEDEDESEEEVPDESAAKKADADHGFKVVGKGGKAIDLSPEGIFNKLTEMQEARGKKSTDKLGLIETLSQLLAATTTAYQRARVLLVLIPARFDYVSAMTGYMSPEMWKKALDEIGVLLDTLDANPHITLTINPVFDESTEPEHVRDRRITTGEPIVLPGNVASFVDRLDDEFTKSLQSIDPHSNEYIERLADETCLYAMIVRAQKYAEKTGASAESHDLMVMRRVEHIYYKPDALIQSAEDQVRKIYPTLNGDLESSVDLVSSLCMGLYRSSIDRIRTRALLCHVYHLALHDQYHQSRDMILMSHLQDGIAHADIQTQVLYNRTMVQIGLCAFRAGLFREASHALQEIASSSRNRELLAQGVQSLKYGEKTAEQERQERQRQLPFHMHVNLDLLECAYLTTAMLLEVPHMAMYAHDTRRKGVSKALRRLLDINDRQTFQGPPENPRDLIVAAAKAMAAGKWRQCRDYINSIKIWSFLPDPEATKAILSRTIQEESLRTYVLTYAPHYETMSLNVLAAMFELPEPKVSAMVSKMIINEELHASLDAATSTVVMHRSAPGIEMNRLEYLAGVYADKVATLVESNERLLEARAVTLGLQEQQHMQMQTSAGGPGGRSLGGGRVGGGMGGRGGTRSGGRSGRSGIGYLGSK